MDSSNRILYPQDKTQTRLDQILFQYKILDYSHSAHKFILHFSFKKKLHFSILDSYFFKALISALLF
jgi:hypothetical protein